MEKIKVHFAPPSLKLHNHKNEKHCSIKFNSKTYLGYVSVVIILNFRALQGALQVHSRSVTRQKHFDEQTNLKLNSMANNQ